MQQLSPYQQAMDYQRKLDATKPLPSPVEFLQICEHEYVEQAGEYSPEIHTKLLGMVTEHLYLESHKPAMSQLLNQTKILLEQKLKDIK